MGGDRENGDSFNSCLAFVERLLTYGPANSPSAWRVCLFVCLLSVSVSKPSVLCPGTQPSRDFSEGRVAQ